MDKRGDGEGRVGEVEKNWSKEGMEGRGDEKKREGREGEERGRWGGEGGRERRS